MTTDGGEGEDWNKVKALKQGERFFSASLIVRPPVSASSFSWRP